MPDKYAILEVGMFDHRIIQWHPDIVRGVGYWTEIAKVSKGSQWSDATALLAALDTKPEEEKP